MKSEFEKKVLIVGDQHIWQSSPENRLDDYMTAILEEVEECFEIAQENNVDAIILLGDLFEKPEPSAACRNLVIDLLQKPWNFRIIALVGNHDVHSDNDLSRTALGTLHATKLLEILDYDADLNMAFHHFTRSLDDNLLAGLLLKNPAFIHCAHGSVGDKLDRFGEYIILFDDVPMHQRSKLLVTGHIHHAMEQTRADGKRFINPGAISRRSASKDNLYRTIQVLLLRYDIRDGDILETSYIPLKSSKPADEIFNLESIAEKKKLKENAIKLVEQVSSIQTKIWNFTTLDDKLFAIKEAAREVNLSEEAIEIAVRNIKKVNEE